MTDHLDRARAGLRLSNSLASKYGARGAFGIYGVAFALLIPQLPIGPIDLDDGMSSLAQEAGQAGAIGPGASMPNAWTAPIDLAQASSSP
jgi:hypothetical protein